MRCGGRRLWRLGCVLAVLPIAAGWTESAAAWAPPGIPWPDARADSFAPDRIGVVRRASDFPVRARYELYRAYADLYWVARARNKAAVELARGLVDPVDAALAACGGSGVVAAKKLGDVYRVFSRGKDAVAGLQAWELQARYERSRRYVDYLWYWLARYDHRTKRWGSPNPDRLASLSTRRWFAALRRRVAAESRRAAAERASCAVPGRYSMTGTITLTNRWSAIGKPPNATSYTLTGLCTATLTFDGSDTVRVAQTLEWSEQLVTGYNGGELLQRTDDWSFRGTQSEGAVNGTSTITFGRVGNYVVTYPSPGRTMPVQRVHTITRRYRHNPTAVDTTEKADSETCWNRYSATRALGFTKGVAAKGSATETHDLNTRRIVSTLTWNLRATKRRG